MRGSTNSVSFIALIMVMGIAGANGDNSPPESTLKPLRFAQLPGASGEALSFLVTNGKKVDAAAFPTILVQDNLFCTSVIVGPNSILMAAHCLRGPQQAIEVSVSGQPYRGICTRSSKYPADFSADWALCLMSDRFEGFLYETIDLDNELSEGTDFIFMGFGCDGDVDGDGTLRYGRSVTIEQPDWATHGFDNSYFGRGVAALCRGDSGGPMFLVPAELADSRKVVGINSEQDGNGTSVFAGTAYQDGADFIKEWADENDTKICGYEYRRNCQG